LVYAQEARFEWGYQQFAEKKEDSVLIEMVVARGEVDYLVPITIGGTYYEVNLWVESLGNSSFVMAYQVEKDGVIFAKIKTVQVMIDLASRKSRPINMVERNFLGKYLAQ
jgi:acyl-CoA thioester hydrolase